MYVVYSPIKSRVFVGDRANNRVVVFSAKDFSVETTVDAGAGVFHMWAGTHCKQLWVNNDIDNTTTVIDLKDLSVLASVPTPADLVAMGGKPHDVIVDPKGKFAYVSLVGVSGTNDYVVKFSTKTFKETDRAAVGKDPHLSLNKWNHLLYVPCQNSDAVYVLNRKNMNVVKELSIPGAHGAAMSRNGLFFYTTNLPNGGVDGLYTIFTLLNTVIGDPTDTPYPVPHNIALTTSGRKLYVTHSGGTSDKVTVYETRGFFAPIPVYSMEVTVGLNPFGLAYVR
jgi:DNA-binding beta-propeller fold protein YncE